MKKKSYITVTDQFCGAGGSSQGARAVANKIGGVEIKLALNHWKLAIETHNTNFPDTIHDCTDISACDPRRYPSTDILITSPECTNHSLAKGKKQVKAQMDLFDKGAMDPAAERSRATMWDVPRFAEYHNYRIIIVENVVDARKWIMWEAWLMAMHSLGYNHKCCYFNSMHFHPTPQSRDRMYVVFWKRKNKAPDLEYYPFAHCQKCEKDVKSVQVWKNHKFGKYRTQYVYNCPVHGIEVTPYYHAAFNVIDWSDIGTRIGDRGKPLSENTIRRIRYGLDKYGETPFQVVNYSPGYCKSFFDPTSTITSNDHHGMVSPFIINDQHSTGIECRVRGADQAIQTLSTQPHLKLVLPFIIKGEHTLLKYGMVRSAVESLQTQTTRQSMALIIPQIVELNRTGKSRPASEPLSTVLAGGNHHGIVSTEAWKSFITYYYGNSQASSVSDPVGTVTTKDRLQLVSFQKPQIEDCYYRMIKPHEVKLAMAFDQDYIILGSGKDQVKQCGNAVTPPVMEWLIGRAIESLK